MSKPPLQVPLDPLVFSEAEMLARADEFRQLMARRRSVRDFSERPVPRAIVEQCLLAGGSAPSGANRQPWHFCVVGNPELKRRIRIAAEQEEREFYQRRAPQEWLDALAPLGTDAEKPFLERAPYLIVVFGEKYSVDATAGRHKNYFMPESVGIATGLLITALHNAGLATLTHTPSPMKFLNTILQRPEQEKPLMILVTGYPEAGAQVPAIGRKTLAQISSFLD